MGNFGWIRDDSLEAFLEGTLQTPDPLPAPPPSFPCPFCNAVVNTSRKLQDHVQEFHSVARPCLHIHGKEPSGNITIRYNLASADLAFFNTTVARVGIKGSSLASVQTEDLDKLIRSYRNDDIFLELLNTKQSNITPARTKYTLAFRISLPNELKEIEICFQEHLVDSEFTLEGIDRFILDKRCSGAAKDYAEGLAKFSIGILQRERSEKQHFTTSFAQYRENFGTALHTLKDFDRPFAKLICSIIRFSFNEPPKAHFRSGFWELDVANSLIHNDNFMPLPIDASHTKRKYPICPIDHGSARIIDFAIRMGGQTRWSSVLNDECRTIASSETLDEMDRQKALAIWARTAWRLDSKSDCVEPLKQISATYPFSRWAETYLEKVTQ